MVLNVHTKRGFSQHSSRSNSVKIVVKSVVFYRFMNRGLDSPSVPSNPASTNSSNPSTPKDSILQKLDYYSMGEVYGIISVPLLYTLDY